VQIGRVRLARVEFNNHFFVLKIDRHVLHAVYFHQHGSQLSHAFVAIFARGRNFDCLHDRVVGALRITRIAWFQFVWSGWVHHLLNARRRLGGRLSRNRFEHTPDIFGQNFLTGGVWMDAVRLIEERIAANAFE